MISSKPSSSWLVKQSGGKMSHPWTWKAESKWALFHCRPVPPDGRWLPSLSWLHFLQCLAEFLTFWWAFNTYRLNDCMQEERHGKNRGMLPQAQVLAESRRAVWNRSCLAPFRGSLALQMPWSRTSSLQNWDNTFLLLQPFSLWYFASAALES